METEVDTITYTLTTKGAQGEITKNAHFSSFYGIPFRHPFIYSDPQVSGCCDMTRKNRTCAELAVAINQALCVYSDEELLKHAIPTTNDLVNIIRDHYPAMFESIFEKVCNVA